MKKRTLPKLSQEQFEKLPDEVRAYISALEEYLAWMEKKINRNSRNTSLPPSSDLISPPKKERKIKKGTKGGQPGHQGHNRPLKKPDRIIPHFPQMCHHCGSFFHGHEEQVGSPVIYQHEELVEKPTEVIQDEYYRCRCGNCQKPVLAEIKPEATECLGPKLKSLGVYLNGECHLSLKKVSRLFQEGFQINVSPATLVKTRMQACEGLQFATKEIHIEVKAAPFKNMDETTWKVSGNREYLWGISTDKATFFGILPTRGMIGAKSLLGDEIEGIVTTDRYGAYNFLPKQQHAFCWSHLERKFQSFFEAQEKQKVFGERGIASINSLFHLWHVWSTGELSDKEYTEQMLTLRQRFGKLLNFGISSRDPEIGRFSQDLKKNWESLFLFSKYHIDPTNNAIERGLRPGVIWRKICMGSRSDEGIIYVGRFLSVTETCKKQSTSMLAALNKVFVCQSHGIVTPPISVLSKIQ